MCSLQIKNNVFPFKSIQIKNLEQVGDGMSCQHPALRRTAKVVRRSADVSSRTPGTRLCVDLLVETGDEKSERDRGVYS